MMLREAAASVRDCARTFVLAALAPLLAAAEVQAQLIFPDLSEQTSAAPEPVNVVHVDALASGANNGTRLRNAVAAITDASESNSYIVQLDPGVYNVGATELAMKPDVSVVGAGMDATTIRGSGGVVVFAANRAVLRDLEVVATGDDSAAFSVYGSDGIGEIRAEAQRVRFVMSNAANSCVGILVYNGAEASFDQCDVSATSQPSYIVRTGVHIQGGATTGSQCELRSCSVNLTADGPSLTVIGISVQAGGQAECRDLSVDVRDGIDPQGFAIPVGGKAAVSSSNIVSSSAAVLNFGVYDAFSTDHTGTVPAEDLPSGGSDTAFTRYNQCAKNGAEL